MHEDEVMGTQELDGEIEEELEEPLRPELSLISSGVTLVPPEGIPLEVGGFVDLHICCEVLDVTADGQVTTVTPRALVGLKAAPEALLQSRGIGVGGE